MQGVNGHLVQLSPENIKELGSEQIFKVRLVDYANGGGLHGLGAMALQQGQDTERVLSEHTVQGTEGGMGMVQLLDCWRSWLQPCSARGHTSMQH